MGRTAPSHPRTPPKVRAYPSRLRSDRALARAAAGLYDAPLRGSGARAMPRRAVALTTKAALSLEALRVPRPCCLTACALAPRPALSNRLQPSKDGTQPGRRAEALRWRQPRSWRLLQTSRHLLPSRRPDSPGMYARCRPGRARGGGRAALSGLSCSTARSSRPARTSAATGPAADLIS